MKNDLPNLEGAVCPLPNKHQDRIVIGHGSGGKMMADLIKNTFYPPLANPALLAGNDSGVVRISDKLSLAVSTDAHVVTTLFLPG